MAKLGHCWVWTLTICLGLVGCGQKSEPTQTAETAEKPAVTAEGPRAGTPAEQTTAPALDPKLHQSFADATTKEPPDSAGRPPDATMTDKSVGKLYLQVVGSWDDVKFVAPNGKRLHYRAVLDTELGSVTIMLLPEIAPNHVRSFVALARAGYYDGLLFERIVRQVAEDQPDTKVEYIEAGCPLGTGQVDQGGIGYWLKPELNAEVTHEPGVVGAIHGPEEDVSACKFYINLCKAPILDGNFTVFGKVIEGLDVASTILNAPVRLNDPDFPEADRPVKPVVIRKVTIATSEEP